MKMMGDSGWSLPASKLTFTVSKPTSERVIRRLVWLVATEEKTLNRRDAKARRSKLLLRKQRICFKEWQVENITLAEVEAGTSSSQPSSGLRLCVPSQEFPLHLRFSHRLNVSAVRDLSDQSIIFVNVLHGGTFQSCILTFAA